MSGWDLQQRDFEGNLSASGVLAEELDGKALSKIGRTCSVFCCRKTVG